MFLEPLQRHLAVCARADLPRMAKLDGDFWNVISMRGPSQPRIDRRGFRQIHEVVCYDVGGADPNDPGDTLGIPRKEHLEGVFLFSDSIAGEPILVHCQAGVSRSTAVALALIVRSMHADGYTMEEMAKDAPQMLLSIRPQAAPNPLILHLGLAEFLPDEDAARLTKELLIHPSLFRNRTGGELE